MENTLTKSIRGLIGVVCLALAYPSTPVHAAATTVRLPVMMYHYISTPPNATDKVRNNLSVVPGLFDQQMKWLSTQGYITVTAEQAVAALADKVPLPAHAVLLTFDDGYADAYTNAYTILKKYHLVGTFFVVTDWLDQNRAGYLSWDQAREMAHNGMSIEAHSLTHDTLVGTDLTWLHAEINNSITDIQKQIGVNPSLFAYPFGRYDDNTLTVIKGSGARVAFTTSSGIADSRLPMFTEPRLRVGGGTTSAQFASELHSAGF